MEIDKDSEIRSAILALVQAHWNLLGLYRATNQTIDEAGLKQPDPVSLRRVIASKVQRELGIAEQQAADVVSALGSSPQFADLLRDYAALG